MKANIPCPNARKTKFDGLPYIPALVLLQARPNWVAWKSYQRGSGKPSKLPINPANSGLARVNDPETWSTYLAAEACAKSEGLDGVGYVLSADDNICGIDLDNCRDPVSGEITTWVQELISDNESYCEVSPSGCGLRLFTHGKPATSSKTRGVEVYGHGRFLTVTGNKLISSPSTIEVAPKLMSRLSEYLNEKEQIHASERFIESELSVSEIEELVSYIPADCSYDQWFKIIAAIHTATAGSAAGLALADRWSATGGNSYDGIKSVERIWNSNLDGSIGIGTIKQMAESNGACLALISYMHRQFANPSEHEYFRQHAQMLSKNLIESLRKRSQQSSTTLPNVAGSSFFVKPVPKRRFHDGNNLIPCSGVTLLFGDGGTGKSLLALQLAVSTATNRQWIGASVRSGPVHYYSCEDDIDETHIRLTEICNQTNCELSELGDIHIAPMVGHDCVLGAPDKHGIIRPTSVFGRFLERTKQIGPALIVIDNAIDVFAGDQNNGAQVKQFMHQLSRLSIECSCPVVVLAHPSKSGLANGVGDGGSVHWSNSARSRLYLSRVTIQNSDGLQVEDDPCRRTLKSMKANYAATGKVFDLQWSNGCFVCELNSLEAWSESSDPEDHAKNVFLHVLRCFTNDGLRVSPNHSNAFAPTVFARHPQAKGLTKGRLERAMFALLQEKKIEIQGYGPPSKRCQQLAIIED